MRPFVNIFVCFSVIRVSPVKNRNCCWVALPKALSDRFLSYYGPEKKLPLLLRLQDEKYPRVLGYVYWSGEVTLTDSLEISLHLASILELEASQTVGIEVSFVISMLQG